MTVRIHPGRFPRLDRGEVLPTGTCAWVGVREAHVRFKPVSTGGSQGSVERQIHPVPFEVVGRDRLDPAIPRVRNACRSPPVSNPGDGGYRPEGLRFRLDDGNPERHPKKGGDGGRVWSLRVVGFETD